MRIVLASGIYPPDAGGPATYTRAMARALVAEGHTVDVVCYGEGDQVVHEEGFLVHVISRKHYVPVRYWRCMQAVRRLAAHADLVYLQGPVAAGVPGTLGARLAGVPTVMKVVGDYAWETYAGSGGKELLDTFLTHSHTGKIRLLERLERWSAKRAAAVITPSQYLKTVVAQWGVPSGHITVIPNAVSALPEGLSRNAARKKFGVEHKRVLLTAVRAVPWKGGDVLVSLLTDLPEDVTLLIAGDGPELKKWEEKARALKVAPRIQFLGRLSREELADAYCAADLFVLASGYEGYPWVVAEAASIGLPSFVSDQGGNPETKVALGSEYVTVLPYQDREAWLTALKEPWPGRQNGSTSLPSFSAMYDDTLHTLSTAVSAPTLRTIFLSYERGLTKPSSVAFERVAGLAADNIQLSAIVLPATAKGVTEQGGLRSIGLTGSAPARLWGAFWAAAKEIRHARKNGERVLISAQDPFLTGSMAFVLSRLLNTPYEVQEHADFFSGAWAREAVAHRLWTRIGLAVIRRANHVRVVSDRIRSQLMARGISENRITVIPVAQNVATLLARTPRSWPSTPTIIVPCRFVKQKGLDVLIDALKIVADKGHAFHVRMVGEGAEGPRLATRAEEQGIRSHISFEHWNDSEALWSDADLFVLSSNYEGWGRTIVEAMAAGIPIVTTDVGCVGSFFRTETDGIVVKSGDTHALAAAIEHILTDAPLRQRVTVSARARIADLPKADALRAAQQGAWQHVGSQKAPSRTAWKWSLAIVLFAAALRLASLLWFGDTLGANREWGFFRLVESWFNGNGYAFIPGQPSAYRSPGFLFFLTGVYGLFGFANFAAQAAIQNILAVVLVYLVYRLGFRVTGDRRIGWAAALLIAVHPYTFYHYTQYYHNVLSSVFLVSLLLSMLALHRTRKYGWAIWAGVMTAALAYIQGTILVAMPFLAAWILWQWRTDIRRAVLAVAVIAVVSMALITPWTLRNWQAFQAFVPLTTDLGFALYKANTENYERLLVAGYPHEALEEEVHPNDPTQIRYHYLPEVRAMLEATGGMRDAAYWTAWHPQEPGRVTDPSLVTMSEPAYNQYWTRLAQEWMMAHPADVARLAARKAIVFWQPALHPSVKYGAAWSFGNEGLAATLARWSLALYAATIELLALAGLFIAARRKQFARTAPLVIAMLAYTAMHMLFAPYTKYRVPLDNLVVVFSAIAVLAAWPWKRSTTP